MINTKIKKFIGLFLILLAVGLYLLIWIVKGQPLITKVGDSWKYTYSTKIDIDDREFTDAEIKNIQRFEWVEEISINFWRLNNLECLSRMKRLKTLLIGIYASANITDWSGISDCVNIENIYITGGELQDLSAFSKLKKLKSLGLEWAYEGAEIDLKDISELSSLEYFVVEGYIIKNAYELNKLHTLKSIIVKGKTEDFISSCPAENLEILSYSDYGESIIDGKDFLKFEKLKQLSIYNARIDNIELLSDLENLESVNVDEELYSNEELMFLKNNGISVNE